MQSGHRRDGAQGDQGEFLEEFTKHSRRLYGFILSLTMNRDDADEAYQSTSIVLYKKYGQFDPEIGSFYTWACRVAHLEVLNLRRGKRRAGMLSEEALELLHQEAVKRSDESKAREDALETCLKRLSPADRKLIEDRYYNELAPKEIAAKLGRSRHAVYRALARVHGMLRRCVDSSLSQEG